MIEKFVAHKAKVKWLIPAVPYPLVAFTPTTCAPVQTNSGSVPLANVTRVVPPLAGGVRIVVHGWYGPAMALLIMLIALVMDGIAASADPAEVSTVTTVVVPFDEASENPDPNTNGMMLVVVDEIVAPELDGCTTMPDPENI